MKPPTSIRINIPQPCHEDWDRMTPQAQGRFCNSCQKCVVDFTRFTDEQLYKFLAEHKGESICGRVNRYQLNRQIKLSPQPHSTLYKWIIAAGLALIFVATPESRSFAQAPFTTTQLTDIAASNTDDSTRYINVKVISGIVIDDKKDPVTGAVIMLKTGTEKIGAVSDIDGNFSFDIPDSFQLLESRFSVHYVGYYSYQCDINEMSMFNNIEVILEPSSSTGLIEIGLLDYNPPRIDKFEGGNSKTFTSEDIENSPLR